jgi:hypothetical protein
MQVKLPEGLKVGDTILIGTPLPAIVHEEAVWRVVSMDTNLITVEGSALGISLGKVHFTRKNKKAPWTSEDIT